MFVSKTQPDMVASFVMKTSAFKRSSNRETRLRKSDRSERSTQASTASSQRTFQRAASVKPANDQGEYYLTDVPGFFIGDGGKVSVYLHNDPREVSGINTRAELAEFENLLRRNTIRRLMTEGGVTFIDPSHAYVSAEAQIGATRLSIQT